MLDGLRRDEHAAEIRAVLAAPVEVAASGWHEIERTRASETACRHCGCVLAVVRLDAREADGRQLRQQLVEAHHGSRMREGGHATVLSHKGDRLGGTEPDARDVRGRVLREKRVE